MANTLKIKVENENVLTQAIINGIDPDNILASWSNTSDTSSTYTIPEDGILFCGTSQNMGRSNSISLKKSDGSWTNTLMGGYLNNSSGRISYGVIPVKKNQVINIIWLNAYLYGVKR